MVPICYFIPYKTAVSVAINKVKNNLKQWIWALQTLLLYPIVLFAKHFNESSETRTKKYQIVKQQDKVHKMSIEKNRRKKKFRNTKHYEYTKSNYQDSDFTWKNEPLFGIVLCFRVNVI